MKKIESLQNENIKRIIKLRKARERKKSDSIIIEGKKEIELAMESGVKIVEFYYCPEIIGQADASQFFQKTKQLEEISIETSCAVFEKISYRDTPDGYLAIARPAYQRVEDIILKKNALILVLENVEKPGNLGALLRTADAVGADLLILNNPQTDIYNPNVIRASRGAVFSVPVLNLSIDETFEFLKQNKIQSLATTGQAEKQYTSINFKKASAIVLGAEHEGLSRKWLDLADELIKIPMIGKVDSLNVSVSGAVIVYEAMRQRGFIQ